MEGEFEVACIFPHVLRDLSQLQEHVVSTINFKYVLYMCVPACRRVDTGTHLNNMYGHTKPCTNLDRDKKHVHACVQIYEACHTSTDMCKCCNRTHNIQGLAHKCTYTVNTC